MIKQLVSVKKDNARLRAEYTAIEAENESFKQKIKDIEEEKVLLQTSHGSPTKQNNTSAMGLSPNRNESEDRYKDINIRLRKLLADERRNLQQVRTNYAQELKSRTEVELMLRQCVDDVRKEIARKHIDSAQFSGDSNDLAKLYGKNPSLIPMEQFTQEDRERALELLLSQERVLTLLYAKAFPINPKTGVLAFENNGPISDNVDNNIEQESRPQTTGAAEKLPGIKNINRPNTGK